MQAVIGGEDEGGRPDSCHRGRVSDDDGARSAGLADRPRGPRRGEAPLRRIATLQRDAVDDERVALRRIETDVGEDELLGAGGARGGGADVERVRSRREHGAVPGARRVESGRRAVRGREGDVHLLRSEDGRGEARSSADRLARGQNDQSVPAAKCIRGAGHGLQGEAAPPAIELRNRVAREGHDEPIGLVHPERQARLSGRRLELHPGESVGVG